MTGEAYISSDDSALLRGALRRHSGGSCLEIGAGNGGTLVDLAERFDLVVGTDIVRPSMSDWRGANVNFVLADGASCLKDSTFALVTFNPPYIAADVLEQAVEGGKDLRVPKSFLWEALRTVWGEGAVVFLLNDDAGEDEFRALCEERGFGLRVLESHRMFFEELRIYSAAQGA